MNNSRKKAILLLSSGADGSKVICPTKKRGKIDRWGRGRGLGLFFKGGGLYFVPGVFE